MFFGVRTRRAFGHFKKEMMLIKSSPQVSISVDNFTCALIDLYYFLVGFCQILTVKLLLQVLINVLQAVKKLVQVVVTTVVS